jgi:ATP-dependent Lhr-like helicase
VRKQPRNGETIRLSAVDPLNLVGVVLPGARVPAVLTNTVTYLDGTVVPMPAADDAGVMMPA